ncbi:putative UPF0481 protein At3g02645 [Dioscorea cayenensis subsp. rotundata]|uniref:UPF0481 protein At3g02645 n=1 Tax=Dioscorea cayennensis subsp. rotundata TaxID=55577 RepID=A0AB40ATL8_DIOCR|nr:putative UPF0481 protein At3g02645 [Dioscorea cayenensis subsp. rotundata]
MTSTQQQWSSSPTSRRPVDELQWVIQIRESIEQETGEPMNVSVSVFSVPNSLVLSKPEAYIPQLFAVGPYHHWDPHLYEMERYKLATARRTQRKLHGINLQQLVDYFTINEFMIRAYYHRYLEFRGETLAWMMAIDASFLLEFLRCFSSTIEDKSFTKVPSMSHMVDSKKIKLAYNLILKDVVMLENQVPLFLLRKIIHFQFSSEEEADAELSNMLIGFVKEISPFKVSEESSPKDVLGHAHLLELLYYVIVPRINEHQDSTKEIIDNDQSGKADMCDSDKKSNGCVNNFFGVVWSSVAKKKGLTYNFVKKVLIGKPIKFLIKGPWSIISKLPVVSVFKGSIESMFCGKSVEKEKDDDDSTSHNKPPLVEEILVPSVKELVRAGVKFARTNQDITSIRFDAKTGIFYLPEVTLDCNTEVLLRNLVTYESSVVSEHLVFTRYTELINGIIDTEEDVKILRECKVIRNRMKSDAEVADLWNEMRRSVRLTKVAFIDKALEDVNKYYGRSSNVKMNKFMETYVLGSWKMLTLLAAMFLLFLSCVEAFCSVYTCRSHLLSYAGVNGN